jgi:hypothetical protein
MQIASLLLWTIEDYATAENEQPQDDVLVEPPIEELATLPAVSPPILETFEKVLATVPAVSAPPVDKNVELYPPLPA